MSAFRQFMMPVLALLISSGLIAQTCLPTPPVCVPSNGYAFQFAGDTDHGLVFNTATTDFEFTNNVGNAVFGVDAFTGNISIPGGGALQVGPNRYAFQFTLTPNYGLFFNAAGFAYEFRTADASPVFSIGANNGNLDADGNITAGGNLNAPSGSVNTGGNVNATSGNVNTIDVNASGTVTAANVASSGNITATSPFGPGGFAVKGIGINPPTNGYLGVQGATDFDGEDSLDIIGQEIGVLGISTGGSITDNTGVLGFSNNIAISAIHELNDNRVDLATSSFAISAAGDSRLDGDAEVTGTMGVGTIAPASGLHVEAIGSEIARFASSVGSKWISLYDGTDRKGIIWSVGNDMVFRADDAGGSVRLQTLGLDRVTVDAAGDVGIGTTSPSSRLDVVGTSEFNGQADFNEDVFVNNRTIIIENVNANINIGGSRDNLANVIGDNPTPTITFASGDEDLWIQDDIEVTGQGYKPGGGLWGAISDARLKRDVKSFEDGLETLLQIEPVRYKYNDVLDLHDKDKEYFGVLAQDVQKVAPYMVEERAFFQKVTENEDGTETVTDPGTEYLTYDGTALTYILVNAIKEQNQIIEELQEKVTSTVDQSELLRKMDDMQQEMDQLKQDLSSCCVGMKSEQPVDLQLNPASADQPWLGQNVPNPFDNSTVIQFYVPESVTQSWIRVYDLEGKEIKSFQLAKGYGQVKFNESDLASGMYVYTLINDGEVIATKRMVLK